MLWEVIIVVFLFTLNSSPEHMLRVSYCDHLVSLTSTKSIQIIMLEPKGASQRGHWLYMVIYKERNVEKKLLENLTA